MTLTPSMRETTPELEAMARAIGKAATLFEVEGDEVEDWLPVARAALLAIREPTEAMISAYDAALPSTSSPDAYAAPFAITAMLDHILGEPS